MNTPWRIWVRLASVKLVFLFYFFSGSLPAADFYQAYRASSPIMVDGRLDEADWSAAAPIHLGDIVTGEKPVLPVMAKILWDNRNSLHKMPAIADLPKGRFDWKMLWVRASVLKTAEDVERMVTLAERMGFNRIAAEPRSDIIRAVHEKKMGFYAWWINLRVPQMKEIAKTHPEYLQRITPEEQLLIGKPRLNPDRENINHGEWLCPDRGLTDEEWRGIEAVLRTNAVDGLALDYIGYRNYRACDCEESNARCRAYAARHPELTKAQVEWRFSEESMAAYTRQIRERALALNPNLKLAIHIYPDFDPNPYYANSLPVDYCGQTIAWFFKPFWSYEREYEITLRCAKDHGKFYAYNAFVPFVGAYAGDNAKGPERLRTEIRIAGSAQTGKIMMAFYETFLAQPELVEVVAGELK